VILALILRLLYIGWGGIDYSDPDEAVYETIARNFHNGNGLILSPCRRASFPPLYPLFLSGFIFLGMKLRPAIPIIQSVLGALSCLWIAAITRLTFSSLPPRRHRALMLITGVMAAAYPPLIFYGSVVMTETLFIFLFLGGIYCFFKREESRFRQRWLLLSGALFALGVLCRPALLPVIIIGPLWLLIADRYRGIKSAACFIAAFFLILFPWQWRNFKLFGRIIPVTTQSGNILYLANNPVADGGTVSIKKFLDAGIYHLGNEEDELIYDRHYRRQAKIFIRANPARFFVLSLKRLIWFYHFDLHSNFIGFSVFLWLLILAAIIGAYYSRAYWKKTGFLICLIVAFTSLHMIFPPEGRYRLPIMPLFFILASLPILKISVRFFSAVRSP